MKLKIVLAGLALAFALSGCGPDIGSLQKGERGKVASAHDGAALDLEGGPHGAPSGVFLAEIGAPRDAEPYAEQARAELESLAVGRPALLAYGGDRTWTPHAREGETAPPRSYAIAHVFVQSEGGSWLWLQHALIARGAAWVRPRPGNHARTADLLAIEEEARAAHRGLWAERAYRVLSVGEAGAVAREANVSCTRGAAPYRIIEGQIERVDQGDKRVSFVMRADADKPFALVVFGPAFAQWNGPAFASLTGKRVRARGPLGMFHDIPQLCLEQASGLEAVGSSGAARQDHSS